MTRITRCIAAVLLLCGVVGTPAKTLAAASTSAAEGKYDALVAPIALYPDALVLQILQCSAAPDQIAKLNDWIKSNPDVKGTAAQDAVSAAGFEPSFVAIVLFPQVVAKMNDQPDWTASIAKAFAEDRNGVFASIQGLRKQAQSMGNLATSEQQQVEAVKTQSGSEVIVIQPTNPQVVYVPQYNPQVVYTQPAPPPQPGRTVAAGLVGFTAGVIIGNNMNDDDDDYYACGGWGYRGSAISEEGFEDYAEHRQDVQKNYYEHRENMASQRGENQGQRQAANSETKAGRQETSSANQAARQESSGANQAARQESGASGQAGANQAARQEGSAANQAKRQEAAAGQPAKTGTAAGQSAKAPNAGATNAQRQTAGASARGQASGASAGRSGTKSSAYSGYQSGTKEREASSRGQSSAAKSSGGGGGSRGGGGGRGR